MNDKTGIGLLFSSGLLVIHGILRILTGAPKSGWLEVIAFSLVCGYAIPAAIKELRRTR